MKKILSFLKSTSDILKSILKKQKSQLLSNMLIVGGISLLVKGISFFKEIFIADTYGVSLLLDTFLIAVLIPTFIQSVFINSYGSVFIPNYLLEKKAKKDTSSFQSSSFIITVGIGLLMILIIYIGVDYYLEYLFPGHENAYYDLIKTQLFIILPCILFWAISSLISGLLMADNEFLVSSLNAIFIPIATIICLFFHNELQEKALALGMLVGSFSSTIYLIYFGFKKRLLKLGSPNFKNDNIQVILKQVPAKVSSGLINGVNPMIDQYFSAQMAIGAIAALNYGYKIPMVTISLLSIPIGSTILPYFSNKAAENREDTFLYLKKMIKMCLIGLSLVTLILIIFSKLIITIFFERGEFNSDNTDIVYLIQQMYFIQIPFYIIGIIMNKYLTAINKNNFLVWSSILSLSLNILFNYTFVEWIGIKGLALATSLVSLINALVIYLYITKQHSKEFYV
ncbi:lipid II flippase MurJ [uncultured Maribacter sp.]|uniref:murein biosynthesis integral membrane protein MurJ n=1 Tax=uncultured Maribacter sp. TaxID=431308 RepID=UPI0026141F86|nr:lipid II flippase MurJ [uncultured Maribacter sp.]